MMASKKNNSRHLKKFKDIKSSLERVVYENHYKFTAARIRH